LEYINEQNGINGVNVIIADVSDDNGYTIECIRTQMNKNINIEIIKGGYPSQGRNAGSKLVETKYVLFLDADIFISNKTLLKNILEEMIKNDYHLGTCKFRVLSGEYNYVYKSFDYIQKFTKYTKPFAIGGFMLFNINEFDNINGFNENDKFAEDYHISMKIKPKKFYIHNDIVYTTSRRFKSKGLYYMVKMMIKSYFNRNNPDFFTKEHNYWN
jgi:hypothetical protein